MTCPMIIQSNQFKSTMTGKIYQCEHNVDCGSINIIYLITCKKCGIQYVGQPSLRLKDRFVHHYSRDIELSDPNKSVGRHFSQTDHRGLKDMEITVLEFIKAPPKSPHGAAIRNTIERNWTHLLRTLAPQGLNMENPNEFKSKKT